MIIWYVFFKKNAIFGGILGSQVFLSQKRPELHQPLAAKGADNMGSSTVSGPGPDSLAEWSKEPGRIRIMQMIQTLNKKYWFKN